MSYYTIEKIYPFLYSVRDPLKVYCYLAVGESRALLYDTGYGLGDIRAAVETVTGLPLDVVLSHGHADHASGAYQFEKAYLHEKDFAIYREYMTEDFRRETLKGLAELPEGFDAEAYVRAGAGTIEPLKDGEIFDLGGLTAEVIEMPGHTAGSVGILLREAKIMLCGDAASSHIWLFLDESLPLSTHIATLTRVSALDFETFFSAHSAREKPKAEIKKYVTVAKHASLEKAKPFKHGVPGLEAFIYRERGAEIVFNHKSFEGDASL